MRLTTSRTYDNKKEIINKLIINQIVLLRTPIIQDAVRCYREIYEEKKKPTVQTKFSMFLIKKTSRTSTQEHDPYM
jgi:ASC-1-like (ASCH) protein